MLFGEKQILSERDIYEQLTNILIHNREQPIEIAFEQKKTYWLVSFFEIPSLRIICGKTNYISFAQPYKKFLSAYPNLTIHQTKSEKLWSRVVITTLEEVVNLQPLFWEVYDEACLLGASEPFGCCSRYMECSDNKKCIQSNPKIYRDCQYRKHLLNGKIFYGVNRNI